LARDLCRHELWTVGGHGIRVRQAHFAHQAREPGRGSPVIAELAGQGKLKVIAAYYDLASGKVTVLG
jgi:hypothetical protein